VVKAIGTQYALETVEVGEDHRGPYALVKECDVPFSNEIVLQRDTVDVLLLRVGQQTSTAERSGHRRRPARRANSRTLDRRRSTMERKRNVLPLASTALLTRTPPNSGLEPIAIQAASGTASASVMRLNAKCRLLSVVESSCPFEKRGVSKNPSAPHLRPMFTWSALAPTQQNQGADHGR